MNKKRVLLSTIGLVVLSGIAATSSTFAWFTTVRTATVSYTSATVETLSGNLNVEYNGSLNTGITKAEGGSANAITLTGANKVTDISGDGVNFYKPVWSAVAGTASSMTTVGTADGFYVDFNLTISRSNAAGATGLKVYLGTGTMIKAATDLDPEDENAVKAARMSVINSDDSVHILYAQTSEPTLKYVVAAPGTYAYGVDGFDVVTAASPIEERNGVPFDTKNTIALADADKSLIADLSGAVQTRDVNFRFWLEGTDEEAINSAVGGIFSVDLNIYALEV